MAIPPVIYQTFKTADLPFITRWHVRRFLRNNPEYDYQFFDDQRILSFLSEAFPREVVDAYQRLQIGAAKADFFRYAILYKNGGIYLDIDSGIRGRLNDWLLPDDQAVIALENNPVKTYVQWALLFAPGHPFLQKTMELMLDNIRHNRFPHDVHAMTGPAVYTKAVELCLAQDATVPHRVAGVDYNGRLQFKYGLSRLLYAKGEHWKKAQQTRPVLRPLSEA